MEAVNVTLIGTAATVPEVNRALASTLIQIGGDRTLIDAGEGTTVSLTTSAGISVAKIDRLIVTHYHADHVLGIPGLLKKRSTIAESEALNIYALPSVCERLEALFRATYTSDYILHEFNIGDELAIGDDFTLTAFHAEHRVKAVGFTFQEVDQPGRFDAAHAKAAGVTSGPDMGILARGGSITLEDGIILNGADFVGAVRRGRKIVVSGDTCVTEDLKHEMQDATLGVLEATFLDTDEALAVRKGHMTVTQAIGVAGEAGAASLALTHLSHRYTRYEMREEAKRACEAYADLTVRVGRDGDVFEL